MNYYKNHFNYAFCLLSSITMSLLAPSFCFSIESVSSDALDCQVLQDGLLYHIKVKATGESTLIVERKEKGKSFQSVCPLDMLYLRDQRSAIIPLFELRFSRGETCTPPLEAHLESILRNDIELRIKVEETPREGRNSRLPRRKEEEKVEGTLFLLRTAPGLNCLVKKLQLFDLAQLSQKVSHENRSIAFTPSKKQTSLPNKKYNLEDFIPKKSPTPQSP